MMRAFFVLLLLFSTSTAHAQSSLHLPSTITVLVGGDRQGSANAAIDGVLALKSNWLIGLGADTSKIPDSDEQNETTVSGAHMSLSTNPLNIFSGDLEFANWRMSDDVESSSLQLGLTFAPLDWVVVLSGGLEQLDFYNLPKVIFSEGKSRIKDGFVGLSVEHFFDDIWGLRVFYTAHRYDQELSEYAEGLRVRFMPPSVLTTVTGFPSSDAGLEVTAAVQDLTIGLELASSKSALDEVKTRRAQLRASYRFLKNWKVGSSIGSSKPENSEEDPRDNRFGSLSLTYFWR